jgi:tetratricopeptide (TPR) repeat protein
MRISGRNIVTIAIILLHGMVAGAQEDLVRRGISLLNASRPMEAEQAFQEALRQNPNASGAGILLGFLQLQRSALPEAQASFSSVLQSYPENASARFGFGIALLDQGLAGKAVAEFERVVDDKDVGRAAQARRIDCLLQLGREDEAFALVRDLAERFPLIPEYQRTLGFFFQLRHDSAKALLAFESALESSPAHIPTYLNLITIHEQRQEWSKVRDLAQRALELDRNHPLLYQALAAACDHLDMPAEAAKARVEQTRTFEAEQQYARAAKARASGAMDEAEKLLRQCVTTNPRLSKAWIDLGEICRATGRLEEARTCFESAAGADPWNVRALMGQAAIYRAEGKHREALSLYQKAVANGLHAPDIFSGMAAEYLETGQTEQAADSMVKAVLELPDDPDLLSYKGFLDEKSGRPKDALQAYSDALRMNPIQADAAIGLAHNQLASGDPRGAAETFRKVIEIEPLNIEAWRGLVQAYHRADSIAETAGACRDCLAHLPQDPECREQLASLELESGDYTAAAGDFEIVLKSGTTSRNVLNGLSFSLLKLGNFSKVISVLEDALKTFGPDPWIYSSLGYAYRAQGDRKAAIDAYRHACSLVPEDPERQYDLGLTLYLDSDYADAAASFESALRLKPEWGGSAHFNLAMAYWQLRQYDKALAHARIAAEKGVREADPVVQTLSAYRAVIIKRGKK